MEGQRQHTLLGTTAFVQKPTQLQPYFDAVAGIVYRWGRRSDSIDPTSDLGERHGEKNDEPKTSIDQECCLSVVPDLICCGSLICDREIVMLLFFLSAVCSSPGARKRGQKLSDLFY